MKHSIPADSLPHGHTMAKPVETCVHCGFCLPDCPTYRVLGQEMDSPRGRIILMKEVLEGHIPLEDALPHIDQCLGCLACETTCPSGVKYGDLISPFRDYAESKRERSRKDKVHRAVLSKTLPFAKRFHLSATAAKIAKPFAKFLPSSQRAMLDLLPDKLTRPRPLPPYFAAHGEYRDNPKARAALLIGCAQQVLAPEINTATIDLLTRSGIEVLVPEEQGCCGALAWHTGDGESARSLARNNLNAFPADVDYIVTNAAGCGSGLQEYGHILEEDEDHERAQWFAKKVVDFTVLLDRYGFATPPGPDRSMRIAYHDACHLAHAQGVREEPRKLLNAIPNIELIELPDANVCCGSAGSYNIDHPEIASELGRMKAMIVNNAGADVTVTGNIGCLTQLNAHAPKQRIQHLAVFLSGLYTD